MKDLFEADKKYIYNEYSSPFWNKKSGLDIETLKDRCKDIAAKYQSEPKHIIKSKIQEFILNHAMIEVNPHSLFADKINHGDINLYFLEKWKKELVCASLAETLSAYSALQDARVFTGDPDFGHTCPDWKYILNNGITGIVKNLDDALTQSNLTEEQISFYESSRLVYTAVLQFIRRLADEAKRKEAEHPNLSLAAKSLKNLSESAPKTLHEAMQLIFIYYMLQQHIDCVNVRSIGALDSLLYKFYKNDIETGLITESDARIMIKYFLYKFHAQKTIANIPFFLCGSDSSGEDLSNPFTHLILEEYEKLDIDDPKIHIRYHSNIDKRILLKTLKMIRNGKNSIVFMNDIIVENALIKSGISQSDARNYSIVGCYEPAADGEVPCSCNGRINIPKVVELAISDGKDLLNGIQLIPESGITVNSFDDFMRRFYYFLDYVCKSCIEVINSYEQFYMQINPSPIFSGAFKSSVISGKDIYAGGAKYNSSSINAFGLATAVDSLIAIRKSVFEEHILSLNTFADILSKDWNGYDDLRLKCAQLYPKYGNNCAKTDLIMTSLCTKLSDLINKKPNGRGGLYRLGLFSIDWRFEFGSHTAATPDGRHAHSTISKNMSATIGCDKNGITSLIHSVTKIDYTLVPNGTVLDIMLHYSSTTGEEGLSAMLGLLLTYMKKGGIAIQFNVLNPDALRDAQKHPEKYKTLQVRLCGWNVYFVDLTPLEQEEFIIQCEHMNN